MFYRKGPLFSLRDSILVTSVAFYIFFSGNSRCSGAGWSSHTAKSYTRESRHNPVVPEMLYQEFQLDRNTTDFVQHLFLGMNSVWPAHFPLLVKFPCSAPTEQTEERRRCAQEWCVVSCFLWCSLDVVWTWANCIPLSNTQTCLMFSRVRNLSKSTAWIQPQSTGYAGVMSYVLISIYPELYSPICSYMLGEGGTGKLFACWEFPVRQLHACSFLQLRPNLPGVKRELNMGTVPDAWSDFFLSE